MTTYNTGNPVGSATVKDLYDNAENLDVAINSQTAGEWTDRLGNARQTWKGIEDKAEIDIAASASAAAASASAAAAGYRDETLAARNDAQAAASAIGPVKFYDTKAQAGAAIGTMANGDIIEVSIDETRAGARTRYKVQAGALVFVVNLDQTKVDLAAATGASLVGFQQAGAGAVSATVQAKLREIVSVKDFGAVGDGVTDDTAAFLAAYSVTSVGGRIVVPGPGPYIVSPPAYAKHVVWDVSFDTSTNLALLDLPGTVLSTHGSAVMMRRRAPGSEYATLRTDRLANYLGGTPGTVSATVRSYTEVGPDVANFEWCLLAVLDNNATAGENVAGYFQANKKSTGPTWGLVSEVRETQGSAGACVGLELDVFANGSANSSNRIGIDIVAGKAVAGETARIGAAIRVTPQNCDNSNATFVRGIVFNGMYGSIFDSQAATIEAGGHAIKLASGQAIGFASDNTKNLSYTAGALRYYNGATEMFRITDDGSIALPGALRFNGSGNTSTSAVGGAASALPAAPSGYLRVFIDGVTYKVPYYG